MGGLGFSVIMKRFHPASSFGLYSAVAMCNRVDDV